MTICWLPYIVSHKLLSLHNFPHNYYFLNLIYSLYYLFWRTWLQIFETQHTMKTLSFNCHLPSLSLQSNLLSTMEAQKTWLLWSIVNVTLLFLFSMNLTSIVFVLFSLFSVAIFVQCEFQDWWKSTDAWGSYWSLCAPKSFIV